MSECRALTNIIGNGIACAFVSWWEGELDRHKLHAIIGGRDFAVLSEPVEESEVKV
jgi:Na+/H+-dicarboxylate symporter